MSKTTEFFRLAQDLANQWLRFHELLGSGRGGRATHAYMTELRSRAFQAFNEDYSGERISSDKAIEVDFYFPDETTIVEVAMNLRDLNSEFERDVLKAIMAQDASTPVTRLVFLTKPGGIARSRTASSQAIIKWVKEAHGLQVEVREFGMVAGDIIDTVDE